MYAVPVLEMYNHPKLKHHVQNIEVAAGYGKGSTSQSTSRMTIDLQREQENKRCVHFMITKMGGMAYLHVCNISRFVLPVLFVSILPIIHRPYFHPIFSPFFLEQKLVIPPSKPEGEEEEWMDGSEAQSNTHSLPFPSTYPSMHPSIPPLHPTSSPPPHQPYYSNSTLFPLPCAASNLLARSARRRRRLLSNVLRSVPVPASPGLPTVPLMPLPAIGGLRVAGATGGEAPPAEEVGTPCAGTAGGRLSSEDWRRPVGVPLPIVEREAGGAGTLE
ncbi:hypothetical protein KC350_g24 [Hortaea werneckii]|nr:hypothetical protein KC350_g24 [Hortaea werneckii]